MRNILVRFILGYLRFFAQIQIKKINPIIIGVGGSSGKSSLCELITIALSGTYTVKQGKGKNSETGIPLDILGITMHSYGPIDWLKVLFSAPARIITNWQRYEVYVVEMGIDSPVEPKNMSYLLKIIQPTFAVTTNISLEHTQYFDKLVLEKDETKRKEKLLALTKEQEMLLLKSLPKAGTAVVNIDDAQIAHEHKSIRAKQLTISLTNSDTDIYAKKIGIGLDLFTLTFVVKKPTFQEYTMSIPALLPKHYASSFLSTIAICQIFDVDLPKVITLLEKNFSLPPGRSTVFKGIKQTMIIDSSYNNATLPPILDMLDLLKIVGGKRRRIAIIGDMRELGTMSKLSHEIVANKVLKTVDQVILIGPLMREYVAPILERNKFPYQSYQTFTQAKEKILGTIKSNDLILVKSSQNALFLERVVEMLLADKKDKDKLCRRGSFWDERRKQTP
ncbi:MAG TPA: Mur ligase family protein [Candidatus Saccharimonadales bacterium]|nr:Mur ligase family protein [Candidatus Saccharimonadales bacterium]